ncbi:g8210 [Coccomyxa viridis]|uniref:G8210 protein n=1 Tax=Coccomyxa viridis TaxID=1274662 RepID=A0ABP1FZU2_9CHLO
MVESGMIQMAEGNPQFDPFMLINRSGSCACSRLLQTRFLGVNSVSIEDKVGKEAEEPGPGLPQGYHVNTKPDDYKLMDLAIHSMMHCEAAAGGTKETKFVAESIARKPVDFGNLIFTDLTTTRFVVVELERCLVGEGQPAKFRAEQRAHILFCLAKYLGYAPKWVRYATSTPENPELPTDLLKPQACPPGSQKESFAASGFGQELIAPACGAGGRDNFKAALGQDTLRVIEIIINRSKRMARIVAEDRQAQGGLPALREQVLQVNNTERGGCLPNEAQPPLPVEVTGTMARHCARCRVPEVEAQLSSCGRCRMKWYCSRACQKAHWKLGHKLYCVQVT